MARVTVTGAAAQAAGLAAERLADAVSLARAEGRTAHLSLAGGRTPAATYERLANLIDDWGGIELWLGDERMVAPDAPDSNYRMLSETLLARTGAVAHPVPTAGSAEQAAERYGSLLSERVPAGRDGAPSLDFALLGLGEDGHTASLFPRAPTLDAAAGLVCVAVHNAPKPPPDRVTLTLEALRAARGSAILAVGRGKAAPAAAAIRGPSPDVPASLLADGPLELILDADAASDIPAEART
ncbi:MAG: 6-phosphogluconolactonase [Solirubrobacterales bacterium]